jgi:hypothetical protein
MQEVFTGKVPYFGMTEPAVMFAVGVKGQIPARPEEQMLSDNEFGDELWSLLVNCWWHQPKERPTSREVHGTVSAPFNYLTSWIPTPMTLR